MLEVRPVAKAAETIGQVCESFFAILFHLDEVLILGLYILFIKLCYIALSGSQLNGII